EGAWTADASVDNGAFRVVRGHVSRRDGPPSATEPSDRLWPTENARTAARASAISLEQFSRCLDLEDRSWPIVTERRPLRGRLACPQAMQRRFAITDTGRSRPLGRQTHARGLKATPPAPAERSSPFRRGK